jgi:dihydroorotase
MQLYHSKLLNVSNLISKFTVAPARLLNLPKGTLSVGAAADITVIDPNQEWIFDKAASASKASNSPFYGWHLKGKAVATIVGGRKVWVETAESATV